jgi:hypothetical protein
VEGPFDFEAPEGEEEANQEGGKETDKIPRREKVMHVGYPAEGEEGRDRGEKKDQKRDEASPFWRYDRGQKQHDRRANHERGMRYPVMKNTVQNLPEREKDLQLKELGHPFSLIIEA